MVEKNSEHGTVQFVDFVHGLMDLPVVGENGLYLYMVYHGLRW
jgi:hypothetical protein